MVWYSRWKYVGLQGHFFLLKDGQNGWRSVKLDGLENREVHDSNFDALEDNTDIINNDNDNSGVDPTALDCRIRHGNNAIRFHRHRIHIHFGSSISVFHADPEFQLKGNIGQDTEPMSKVPITLPVWWVPSSPNLPCLKPPEPIQHSCSSPPSPKSVHPVVKALNRDK